jgi:transposase
MASRRSKGPRGRPRCRPDSLLGDRAYDAEYIRDALRARQILPRLAMRNTKHGSGLGRWRWVVERTFAWLNQFRRLRVRYEKRPDMHLALLTLACILICWKFLQTHRGGCPVSPWSTQRNLDASHKTACGSSPASVRRGDYTSGWIAKGGISGRPIATSVLNERVALYATVENL